MARIALTCSCGWNFFVPGSTPGHVIACPSCTRPVAIPGRIPGVNPLSPGEIAARVQQRAASFRYLLGLGLLLAAGAAFLYWRRALPAGEPPAAPTSARKRTSAAAPPTSAPPAPRPASVSSARVAELRGRVHETVRLINMTSIVSECLRLRNLAREWSQMQASVTAYEARVKADLAELAGANEKIALAPYFAEGDRILRFGQRDLTLLTRADAAEVLQAWMNAWEPGSTPVPVDVQRDQQRVTLSLQFPEYAKELAALLRSPSLQLPPEPDRASTSDPMPALSDPEAVAKEVDHIAGEVIAHSEVFSDVVTEMRRRTERMTTPSVPVWPDEAVKGIALIGNPLTFKPGELTGKAAQEIAAWWKALSRDQRTRFAAFFGLWCANTRAQSEKK
jgi:hypothetical protein